MFMAHYTIAVWLHIRNSANCQSIIVNMASKWRMQEKDTNWGDRGIHREVVSFIYNSVCQKTLLTGAECLLKHFKNFLQVLKGQVAVAS